MTAQNPQKDNKYYSSDCPHCKRRIVSGARGICKICTVLWMDIGTEKYREIDYITEVEKSTFTKEEKERFQYIKENGYLTEVFKGDWFEFTDNPPRPKKK